MNFGKTILVGRLTRDPEMRYVGKDGDIPVTNFTIAVNEGYGDKETTEFVRVAAWRKQAETCAEHLIKGQEVLVEGGVPKSSAWINDEGEARSQVELSAHRVQFGAKPRNGDK
jgi:single-strand DNA-binding protein